MSGAQVPRHTLAFKKFFEGEEETIFSIGKRKEQGTRAPDVVRNLAEQYFDRGAQPIILGTLKAPSRHPNQKMEVKKWLQG